MERLRLFESADNDVSYVYGRPLRFDAELVRRLSSKDGDEREAASEEARARCRYG